MENFEFITPTGDREVFANDVDLLQKGGRVRNLPAFMELLRERDRYIVRRWDINSGEVRRYCFVADPSRARWPLSSIEDLSGQALDLTWNPDGSLAAVRQRLERRWLSFKYTGGFIESVLLHGKRGASRFVARYEYDTSARLSAAYDAADSADRYRYDAENRIIEESAKDGGVFFFTYDRNGRCIRTSGLDRYDEKSLRILDASRWTEVTNSLGHTTRYQWTAAGQIVAEVNPRGGTRTKTYDSFARIASVTDELGNTTAYKYDEDGNRCRIIDALGQVHATQYNEHHQPIEYTDSAGNSWKLFYDDAHRLVTTVDPQDAVHALRYDEHGNLIEAVDPLGKRKQYRFAADGTLLGTTDWEEHNTVYEPDDYGRLLRTVDPRGAATSFRYDVLGKVVRVDYPDRTSESFAFDAGGNIAEMVNRNGHVVRYRHGPCHRLLERVDALGNTSRFEWGTEPDQILAIVNPTGERYELEYNELNRISREISFDGRPSKFEYDLAGRRIARINALDQRIEFVRDALGRAVAQNTPDGSGGTFGYDEAGFLKEARNANGQISFERDSLGRVVREIQNGRAIVRTFDAVHNLRRLQSGPDADITYAFDGNKLLSAFQVQGFEATRFERDARGSEVRRDMPGQVQLLQQFDAMAELEHQEALRPADAATPSSGDNVDVLLERAYGRTGSLIASLADRTWGSTRYSYDPADRLTTALRQRGASEHFEFDRNSNLVRTTRGNEIESFLYEAGDKLVQRAESTYRYDPQGRLIAKVVALHDGEIREWHFQWDALDRLTGVTRPDGERWTYLYDAFSRRISKISSNGRRLGFVWDKEVVLHEIEGETVAATWVSQPDGFVPLCKVEGKQLYSVVTDHLGTPRELIDQFGSVAWRADYWSWGELREIQATGVTCPIRFQGQWWDEETGLHYNRYRFYDPKIGRYLSADPLGIVGGLNQYSYVANPIIWIDPLGLVINTTADRTHVTYEGTKDGKPYIGYASMPGNQTGEDVIAYRYGGDYASEGLDGAPKPVYVGHGETLADSREAKATARGLEQRKYEAAVEANGGDASKVANKQNPVGETNENRDKYLENADAELAKQKKAEEEAAEAEKGKKGCTG